MVNNLKIALSLCCLLAMLIMSGCADIATHKANNSNKASKLNLQLGVAYLKKGDMLRAQRKLEQAYKQNPHNIDAITMLAYWHQLNHQDKLAQHWYQKGFKQQPHNLRLINNYSYFLCQRGQFTNAVQGFLYVARHYSHQYQQRQAYENAGLCSFRGQNPQRARQLLAKASALKS